MSRPARSGRLADGRRVPAAVLFDMDGLLVATEHVWFEVESALVRELGGEWGPADQEQLVGGPLERTVAHMAATVPQPVDEQVLRGRLLEAMVHRLRRGPVDWMPGARRLLAEVTAAGVPFALVSSSRRAVVDAVLAAIGSHLFPVTVSGDDVHRTKPHPDPYLLAATRLRVDPARAVALEDSATGAAAARAAGCVTVVVPSIAAVPDGLAHHRAHSLEEIGLDTLAALVLAHT